MFGRRRRAKDEAATSGSDPVEDGPSGVEDQEPDDLDGLDGLDGSDDLDEFVDDLDEQDRAREDAILLAEIEAREAAPAPPVLVPPRGPWDVADVPGDGTPRVDLGGLRVPAPEGAEVRVEVGEQGEIAAITVLSGASSVQVSAFAAPRSEGIWAEVRDEITGSLSASGGSAEAVEGPWGTELRASVPTQSPTGGLALAQVRFVGVDGPRWFLRAVFSGPAAVDPEAAALLEQALRDVVVVRGSDPMAVRDPLPLRLPDAVQEPAADDVDEDDDADPLALPERGPEITETR